MRAALGRIIRGDDDVLDRDRTAVQRAEPMALKAALVEFARLGKRMLAVEMGEGLDLAVERFDAFEAGAGIVLGRDRAATVLSFVVPLVCFCIFAGFFAGDRYSTTKVRDAIAD